MTLRTSVKSWLALGALLGLVSVGVPLGHTAGEGPRFVLGDIIVAYKASATAGQMDRARKSVGALKVERITRFDRVDLVRIPAGADHSRALGILRRDPAARFAEPNWIHTHDGTVPNDPSFGQLWSLNNVGQPINDSPGSVVDADIDAPEAWDRNTGSGTVFVGVIDQGIDINHQDLVGVVGNPGEVADGLDNDGNGFVDDVYGWDFVNDDNTVYDGHGPKETLADSHGTHVSGTIGAVGNNGAGVVGVNWSVRLISAKFLGVAGGTTADAIKAVDYFTDLKARGVNIVATNNSWGGGGFSQALRDAIERAGAADILFVAAAGNSSSDNDVTPHYPSSYDNASIVAVASFNRFDALSGFSSFGATSVDVAAPGSTVLSTTPRNTYSYFSGTSMATPHVSGLCALLKSQNSRMSAASIKGRIMSTVVPTPALAGKCLSGGRINAYRALFNTTRQDP